MSEFFNLFSEAEPFAAILIAHGTFGGLLRPEGLKFEAEGGERGRGSWEWAVSPS